MIHIQIDSQDLQKFVSIGKDISGLENLARLTEKNLAICKIVFVIILVTLVFSM